MFNDSIVGWLDVFTGLKLDFCGSISYLLAVCLVGCRLS